MTTHNALPIAKVAGVTGWPIHHSLSPLLHNYWLKEAGLNGAYIPFAVRPDEAYSAFQSLKRTTLAGVNVTTPLKQIACQAADILTEDAQQLGVANCLYVRDGKLVGHNTDMEGFAAPLIARSPYQEIAKRPCVLIGAGGASRAVIGALLTLGFPEIRLINRTNETAAQLAAQISIPSLYARRWEDRHDVIEGAGLIVNATVAGMSGKPKLDISLEKAPTDAWVYDLIYTPLETDIMLEAKRRGMNVIGGLDMLIAQARPSFKAFYGQLPPKNADPTDLLVRHLLGQGEP